MKNDPAREGEAVECHRQADRDGPNKSIRKSQSAPLDPVDTFFAGEPDNKRAIRKSINRFNAASAVRSARSPCGDAQALFWQAAMLAGMWCYRPCTEESLKAAFKALRHMYQAANLLEWLETPDG